MNFSPFLKPAVHIAGNDGFPVGLATVNNHALRTPMPFDSLFEEPLGCRAMTMERHDGLFRVVYEAETGLVTGLQAAGSAVAEVTGEFALTVEMCATLKDVADAIQTYPTLGEGVQEVPHLALHIQADVLVGGCGIGHPRSVLCKDFAGIHDIIRI